MRAIRRLLDDVRGQATVEFAVTLPIFLVLIMGIIHFGKAYYQEQNAQIAVRYITWKAGRHDPNHSLSAASSKAQNDFKLAGASISGGGTNDTLENISDFDPTIFLQFPDPGGLTNPTGLINYSQIATMLATGIAPVDTHYEATVVQPIRNSLIPYASNINVTRSHKIAIGNWDYEDINGNLVLWGYEAYLDMWAYNEIYGLCDWCF